MGLPYREAGATATAFGDRRNDAGRHCRSTRATAVPYRRHGRPRNRRTRNREFPAARALVGRRSSDPAQRAGPPAHRPVALAGGNPALRNAGRLRRRPDRQVGRPARHGEPAAGRPDPRPDRLRGQHPCPGQRPRPLAGRVSGSPAQPARRRPDRGPVPRAVSRRPHGGFPGGAAADPGPARPQRPGGGGLFAGRQHAAQVSRRGRPGLRRCARRPRFPFRSIFPIRAAGSTARATGSTSATCSTG